MPENSTPPTEAQRLQSETLAALQADIAAREKVVASQQTQLVILRAQLAAVQALK